VLSDAGASTVASSSSSMSGVALRLITTPVCRALETPDRSVSATVSTSRVPH
jgi:hypothetical protein